MVPFFTGLGKKIDALAKRKNCQDVGKWHKAIKHHMYHVASTTPDGDGEKMVAKWQMLPLHVQNIHRNKMNKLQPKCEHARLRGATRNRLWLKPGKSQINAFHGLILCGFSIHNMAHAVKNNLAFFIGSEPAVAIENLLTNKRLLDDISHLSPKYQTSTLEAKHSLDNNFVPKSRAFSYNGMKARYVLYTKIS